MSLFGSTQPGKSLFGNTTLNQPQQQSGSSLFSNLGSSTQQKPATSNLFGNLSQPAQPQQQQQPATTGLFSNTTAPQTQQQQGAPASGGLFANLGAQGTQQPQQQSQQQQNGALGSLGSTSLFNTTAGNVQDPPPPRATAQFQHLLERGKKRQADPSSSLRFGELPTLQLGLSDIASKVRNLGGAGGFSRNGRTADSKAHYLLAASGVPVASTQRDLDEFATHSGATSNAQVPAPFDTDIDAYVNGLQAKSAEELYKGYMEQTKRDFDKFVEERIDFDREAATRRIYEHFGLAKPSDRSVESSSRIASPGPRGAFGRSSRKPGEPMKGDKSTANPAFGAPMLSKSVLGSSIGRGSMRASMFSDVAERSDTDGGPSAMVDSSVRNKQGGYAVKVRELNSARLQENVYPVIEEFARVEVETGNDTPQHLIDAYRALKEIVRENPNVLSPSEPGAVRERQYAKDYLGTSGSGRSLSMRKQILSGSKKFLEDSFFQSVEILVAKNPREANLGGVPSKINKIRAYIRIRAARRDLGVEVSQLQVVAGDQPWALIFYLLRSGLVEEAAQYIAENDTAFKTIDKYFGLSMAAYARDPEGRLPRELQSRIEHEYTNRKNTLLPGDTYDPFKSACYKILGRCDLGVKNVESINTGMEDWMWVMLSLARESTRIEEVAGESFGLEDARTVVESVGQRHFESGDDSASAYATYFLLQILVGTFEKAVAWLQAHNYTTAVHFAIALNYYGLLRVSDFQPMETRLLTTTTTGEPQISFGRLLGYYTRDFRIARAEVATDYLTLICLNADLPGAAGQSQVSVCHEALKELVLETREFASLLGDIRADGKRIKGAIEQRLRLINLNDRDEFLRTLTVQAAAVADDSGRTTDAVLLYHLAEEYDSVILVINRTLSEAISVEIGRENMRLQPLKPRTTKEDQQQILRQQQELEGSLSLTSVDDPAVLARNMISLYNVNAMYFQKIRQVNRDACGILIRMSEAKGKVEAGKWAEALDMIASLDLLPLEAKSNISVIRSSSQAFNSLPHVVARNIGSLLMWTITCLGRQRETIKNSAFQAQRPVSDDLLIMTKDLMVFAGLIRYKLPPDVFDVLARAGQDVGVY